MKIVKTKNSTIQVLLSWDDIDSLKKGSLVAERYNGEHKINLSCISETLFVSNWTETADVKHQTKFDSYLNDFFIELSVFDIRNQFVSATNIILCDNPYFKKAKIIYPN